MPICPSFKLARNRDGIAVIEFALLAPLFILLMLAVIEFGLYFTKYLIAQRAVSAIASAVQVSPGDPTIQGLSTTAGLNFVQLTVAPNYMCAQSYNDLASANAGLCANGAWNTGRPSPGSGPYYVAIVSFIKQIPLSTLMVPLPDLRASQIVRVGDVSGCPIIKMDNNGRVQCNNDYVEKKIIDPDRCRVIDSLSNPTFPPANDGVAGAHASCASDEVLMNGGARMSSNGSTCTSLANVGPAGLGFIHFSAPAGINQWDSDAAKYYMADYGMSSNSSDITVGVGVGYSLQANTTPTPSSISGSIWAGASPQVHKWVLTQGEACVQSVVTCCKTRMGVVRRINTDTDPYY